MSRAPIQVVKSSGEKVDFSLEKLRTSLRHSGAGEKDVVQILDIVRDELYQGISTKEIYNRAFKLLKRKKSVFASKYKLKKALYEFGPTGYPLERFIGQMMLHSGYNVQVGQEVTGKCVNHEVDVVATKDNFIIYVECKFHAEEGRNCNVKIPLYINSRYRDIAAQLDAGVKSEGWVVTNTRFTTDAIDYGTCAGLKLLSWDFPEGNGLKDHIDSMGLYPITVSTLLSSREKNFLLSRDVVLCKQLIEDKFFLDHLGISDNRQKRIMNEIELLCNGDS